MECSKADCSDLQMFSRPSFLLRQRVLLGDLSRYSWLLVGQHCHTQLWKYPIPRSSTHQMHSSPHILTGTPPLFLILSLSPLISSSSLVMQGIALLYSSLVYHCPSSQPDPGRAVVIQNQSSLSLSHPPFSRLALYLNNSSSSLSTDSCF